MQVRFKNDSRELLHTPDCLKDFDDMLYFAHDNVIEHFNNYIKINSQSEQNKSFIKTK